MANGSVIIDVDLDSGKAMKGLKSLGSAVKNLGVPLAALGAAGVAAIGALVDSTAELNTDLARLKSNAETAGFGVESMEDAMKKVAAISGEMDSAIETVSNLMQTDFSENQLGEALDYINGAAIRFSDTLNTEGIADGLQETFANGAEATGQFGELLERSGINLDEFNAGLVEATANGMQTDYVLQTLASTGLKDTYDQYLQSNPEIQAYNEANTKLQVSLAELGKMFTPLVTSSKEFLSSLIGLVTGSVSFEEFTRSIIGDLNEVKTLFGSVDLSGFTDNLDTVKDIGKSIMNTITSFFKTKLNEIFKFWDENGAQITAAVRNAWTTIKAIFDFFLPAIQVVVSIVWNAIKNIIDGALNLIMGSIKVFSGLFTGDFKKMWEGIKQVFSGAIDLIMGIMTFTFIGGLKTAAINLGKTLLTTFKGNWASISNVFTQSFTGILSSIRKFIPNAVSQLSNFGTLALNAMRSLPSKFTSIGKDMIQGLINGIKNMSSNAIGAITGVVDGVVNKAKSLLGINSPSKLFDQYGQWIDEGLERGINKKSKLPLNATSEMVNELSNAFVNPLKNATIGLGIADAHSSNIINNYNNGIEQKEIVATPVILNGKIVGELAFDYVNKKQQSSYSINSIVKGVT